MSPSSNGRLEEKEENEWILKTGHAGGLSIKMESIRMKGHERKRLAYSFGIA
jgi:hypothetical protein